ncbi:HD domain-containing protein [Streptomyces spongiae]|uniref:HD domain-containing protein n=1 Tax=Streptomyces spongiae TaxID=565072 RepID=A0A5N8XKH5_9ACTN|nr:HD domain-containing protein [Streptomyces spongiae]
MARFLYEAGTLKQTKRTGRWMAGVRDPESVAEHETANELADAVLETGSLDWLRAALGEKQS